MDKTKQPIVYSLSSVCCFCFVEKNSGQTFHPKPLCAVGGILQHFMCQETGIDPKKKTDGKQRVFISTKYLHMKHYIMSHPENDRDVTDRAKGYTLQDASFVRQSRDSLFNA